MGLLADALFALLELAYDAIRYNPDQREDDQQEDEVS